MSDENKQAETVFVPPSQMNIADLQKALQEEGLVPEPIQEEAKPEAPVETKVEPVKETPKPAEKAELPALLKIAKEREAFRKEIEQAKPHLEALRAIPPHTVSAIAKAISSGDPVSLLAAAGMTHAQYNSRLLGTLQQENPKKDEKAEMKEPAVNEEYAALRKEIEALRSEREAEKLQSTRSSLLGQMREILKKESKYELVNAWDDVEGVERVIIDYHSKFGTLPGETLQESVLLAAEAYENQLREKANKWQEVLTKTGKPVVVSQKAPELPVAGSERSRTLTNANTTAPAVPRTAPKTRQEVLDAISAGRFEDLET